MVNRRRQIERIRRTRLAFLSREVSLADLRLRGVEVEERAVATAATARRRMGMVGYVREIIRRAIIARGVFELYLYRTQREVKNKSGFLKGNGVCPCGFRRSCVDNWPTRTPLGRRESILRGEWRPNKWLFRQIYTTWMLPGDPKTFIIPTEWNTPNVNP